jgi:hypothetical protein
MAVVVAVIIVLSIGIEQRSGAGGRAKIIRHRACPGFARLGAAAICIVLYVWKRLLHVDTNCRTPAIFGIHMGTTIRIDVAGLDRHFERTGRSWT